jgi:hypothetical protein
VGICHECKFRSENTSCETFWLVRNVSILDTLKKTAATAIDGSGKIV